MFLLVCVCVRVCLGLVGACPGHRQASRAPTYAPLLETPNPACAPVRAAAPLSFLPCPKYPNTALSPSSSSSSSSSSSAASALPPVAASQLRWRRLPSHWRAGHTGRRQILPAQRPTVRLARGGGCSSRGRGGCSSRNSGCSAWRRRRRRGGCWLGLGSDAAVCGGRWRRWRHGCGR